MNRPNINKEAHDIELNTYRFQCYDSSLDSYFPCLSLFDENHEPQFDYLPDEYVRVKLYDIDPNQKNNKNSTTHNLIELRNKYFGDILFSSINNKSLFKRPIYTSIILTKVEYESILRLFKPYNLHHVKDILLEVIARAQCQYIGKIAYYKKRVSANEISTAHNEADNLISVLKDIFSNDKPKDDNRRYLKSITFDTNNPLGKTKIAHRGLLLHIEAALDEYFNDTFSPKWEHWIGKSNKYYDQIDKYKRFEKKLAFAIHSFMVNEKIVKIRNKETTPNKLMNFILHILEKSNIYVEGPSHTEQEKAKVIRTWIIGESSLS